MEKYWIYFPQNLSQVENSADSSKTKCPTEKSKRKKTIFTNENIGFLNNSKRGG
jgi:hypothetical protein